MMAWLFAALCIAQQEIGVTVDGACAFAVKEGAGEFSVARIFGIWG